MKWELSDLVGVGDLAKELGESKATIVNWSRRYNDFPQPLARISNGPVYSRQQVTEWRASHEWNDWPITSRNQKGQRRKRAEYDP